MMVGIYLLNLLHWLAGILLLGLSLYSFQFRRKPIVTALALFFFLAGYWATIAAIIPHVSTLALKAQLNRFKMLSPALLPLSMLYIAISLHSEWRMPRWVWTIFWIPPLISIALTLSPEHYELFVHNYRILEFHGYDLLAFDDGPWFQIHNVLGRIVVLLALFLIFTSRFTLSPQHRPKTLVVALALFVPFVADSLAVFMFPIFRFLQATPALLMFTGVVMVYAVLRHHILDIVPFGRIQILDHTDDMYLIFDSGEKLVDYNQTAARTLLLDRIHLGESKAKIFADRVNLDLGPFPFAWTAHGEHYDVRLHAINDPLMGQVGQILHFRNISLQKKIETELEEINALKTKILAIVGHDLQGNLASLALHAKHLHDSHQERHPEDLAASLENLYYGSLTCIEFVEQLLGWSKTELLVQAQDTKSFDLEKLAGEVISFHQDPIIDKNLDVSLRSSLTRPITADANLVRVILRNLLSNAVKFTPQDGRIAIELSERDQTVHVAVEDNGIGLTVEELGRIFDFDRQRRSSLGLFLCVDSVRRLGGKIWAESAGPAGSRFLFTLPAPGES